MKRIALIAILTATLAGALGNASAHAARPQPYPQFPFSQQAAFNVQWYGGPVMPYAENVLVLWGTNTNVPASSILNSLLTDMRDAGPADPYNIALQYGTQGRTPVGAGSPAVGQPLTNSQDYSGSPITIIPSVCSGATACTVSDMQVQAELNHQIDIANVPAPRQAFGGR